LKAKFASRQTNLGPRECQKEFFLAHIRFKLFLTNRMIKSCEGKSDQKNLRTTKRIVNGIVDATQISTLINLKWGTFYLLITIYFATENIDGAKVLVALL